jgi:hypothetical protein
MAAGELPAEPEVQMDSRGRNKKASSAADVWNTKKTEPKAGSASKEQGPSAALEDDAFFGGGEEEEEEEESD